MKIKSKLLLGIGVLFSMIVLLTVLSSVYVNKLAADSKSILNANYNTLHYTGKMLRAVNAGLSNDDARQKFARYLQLQQSNITEPGEDVLTAQLARHFQQVNGIADAPEVTNNIISDLSNIMQVNMEAIQRKSGVAQHTADRAIFWILLSGTICFLAAFIMLVNLPGNIANPVQELTESIKAIAAGNYKQRLHFQKRNEFGELAEAFNTMAQKLEEYKDSNIDKLMIEKKRIETLINNMTDPVIGLDEKMRILFMNHVAINITGLQSSQVMGKMVQDIAIGNDLVRVLARQLIMPDGDAATSQSPMKIFADNKESYFQQQIIPISIVPTGETLEKRIGTVILLQNITAYKELDFAKTNFIATVSHELKTPIASIKMSLQLLDNPRVGNLNNEQQSLVHSIREDAGRLLKITGELLNMTQVETGTIQLNVQPSVAAEIVQEAIAGNRAAADHKHIELKVSLPADLPLVIADKDKTSWVLNNFVSNAIRYSYEHAIIYIEVNRDAAGLKFAVKDTGRGIAPEYIDKVFDRYFKIPDTQKEGTGLGLSISREFIQAQNGSIHVSSDYGSGSEFSFILPAGQ